MARFVDPCRKPDRLPIWRVGSFGASAQVYRKWINTKEIRQLIRRRTPPITRNGTIRIGCQIGGWVCLAFRHSTGEMGSFRRGGRRFGFVRAISRTRIDGLRVCRSIPCQRTLSIRSDRVSRSSRKSVPGRDDCYKSERKTHEVVRLGGLCGPRILTRR